MRISIRTLAFAVLAGGVLMACSGNSPSGTRGEYNVIRKAEMVERGYLNAYDAVAGLRGNWLVTKGTDSFVAPGKVLVYIDNSRLGGVETLRDLSVASIVYIRWIDGVTASARWGLDHQHGVIFVSSHEREGL